MSEFGFVGLGRMGQSMAINMSKKGFGLSVFDIREEAMKPFNQFNNCRQAMSANDTIGSGANIITVLPGPAEVESVVLAKGGLLDEMKEGSVLMDLSTVLPETTDKIAKAAKERGCQFVDAPIGRLAQHADSGESLFMVGAEDEAFEIVQPALEAMGTTILRCGGPGTGTRTKLINNYLVLSSVQMNSEAIALTQRFGLDLETTLNVVHGTTATNGQLKINFASKVFKNDIEPGFSIDLAHKDMTLIIESANKGEIPMPIAASTRESMSLARANGWGKKDFSALADFWCEMSKVKKARFQRADKIMEDISYLKRLPITGYLNNISGRPGDKFEAKISSEKEAEYSAEIVRIICADPNPEGPGLRYELQDFGLFGSYQGRRQEIDIGSYAEIPPHNCFTAKKMLLGTLIQPGLLRESFSVIASSTTINADGWALKVNANTLKFTYYSGKKKEEVYIPIQLNISSWYHVWAGYDVEKSQLLLGYQAKVDGNKVVQKRSVKLNELKGLSGLILAAKKINYLSEQHFNGRLEGTSLYTCLPISDEAPCFPEDSRDGKLLAWWDFSIAVGTQSIIDRGPLALSGRLKNIPYRGMRGASWSGGSMHWKNAPKEYSAIHFHEDDLYDCCWETDFTFEIPHNIKSGVYGLKLNQDNDEDIIPFYILPAKGHKKNKICYLASTFTYQAYANHRRGNCDSEMRSRMVEWGANLHNPDDYTAYGQSTYNFHPDGTGTSISSRLRPILTHRPGFLTFTDRAGSGLRHFSADSHLLNWFEDIGFEFDVITDEDLDNTGIGLISDYNTLITGSHPEYHTSKMLDTLQSYRDSGGKLIYLGGNGFYWKITRTPTLPGVIELRRAEGGIRAWATAPGESYHQLDGDYGGLWRRNGRPPQALVGVGFSAQGLFESSYYRRMPDSYKSSTKWIFENVTEEKLGDYGLSGGGAAGFELDRADYELGSPVETMILARSENHSDSFVAVPEELLSHINTVTGENPNDLIRAEIVYAKLPKGGEIFSVGSICFCGSLNHNNGKNGISQMLENVVRRFSNL